MIRIAVASLLLVGCASMMPMPGDVRFSESKVDGVKSLGMSPAWIWGNSIKLALFKTSEMKPNEIYMFVEVKGDTIQSKRGLVVNIDGEKKEFSSIDTLSEPSEYGFFRKTFIMNEDYVQRMMSGKSVWVRVVGNGSAYFEGEFTKGGPTTAYDGFKEFFAQRPKL